MRDIKYRYTVKRKNGHTFCEYFTIEQIEKGEANLFIKINHVSPEELTREQYTTRKDKNSKEIYEGDKLLFASIKPLIKIEFKNGGFGYKYFGDFHFLTAFKSASCKINGNIHEA